MDYNKSYIFNPLNNKLKQAIKKQCTIESKNNTVKRKSDDIHFYNFLSKYKHVQKYKINKIPKNQRFSYEDKNAVMPNIIKTFNNTKNNNVKKDSKYYVNFVNGIYLNDSHLSNKNVVKMGCSPMNIINNFEKKKTSFFPKGYLKENNSTKKSWSKNSKKKLSCCSNDIKNKTERKIYNYSKSNKKCNIASNKENEKSKKYLSENYMAKYHSTKGISKLKYSENTFSKNKSSRNLLQKNSDILIEEKNEETEIVPKGAKIMNNNENKKNNKNEIKKINKNENTGIETEKCDSNNRNTQKKINDNKKQRKYKCLFCCFNNNSFSDIE
jgi:hypothetical protein